MKGINVAYCNAAIQAVLGANSNLMQATVGEVLQKTRYGKGDTLGFDAIPEIEIANVLSGFDPDAVLITEELGSCRSRYWPPYSDPEHQPVVFFCDPTDRSSELGRFLEKHIETNASVEIGNLLSRPGIKDVWVEIASGPVSVTGATSAISCVRQGRVMFSVVLNYIAQELSVACSAGVYLYPLTPDAIRQPRKVDLDLIITQGQPLSFLPLSQPESSCRKAFTTFLGKSGYAENFRDSMIFLTDQDKENCKHYDRPGGPARILYLSNLQSSQKPIGFILANGEKIGEWIHWLAFIRFAQDQGKRPLILFEIWHERPWTKDGILMSTSPAYSVFQPDHQHDGCSLVDVSQLARFPNPSRFRATLLVAPANNQWALQTMRKHGYRQIILPLGIPS